MVALLISLQFEVNKPSKSDTAICATLSVSATVSRGLGEILGEDDIDNGLAS